MFIYFFNENKWVFICMFGIKIVSLHCKIKNVLDMSKTKAILDEKIICDEYLNSKIGIETLALKYHVGKLRIKQILSQNGIQFKKRGGQNNNDAFVVKDYHIKKYIDANDYHYEVFDKNTEFKSYDINNNGGVLTSYIKKQYNVEIPTLYDRRMYYMKTGNYWWEQWLSYRKVENKPVKKCPFCEWVTSDVENKSGAFEQHLKSVHNISKFDYIKNFPEEKKYFQIANPIKNRQMEDDTNKFITCKICGKKLTKISNAHLKFHGITKEEYILRYGKEDIMCADTLSKFRAIAQKNNLVLNEKGIEKYTSAAEKEIISFINNNNLECHKDRSILNGREIDIYVPEKRVAIEYNGLYWHCERFGKDKNYHLNKLNECNAQGIKLIQIFDDEFIEKHDIVMSKIAHILHINHSVNKIYARKCTVKEIYKYQAEEFLNKYHIQGFAPSTVYLGCYYNNELIGVMTFKHGSIKIKEWELNRFATNYNYHCVGIGGKLFSYFIKNYNSNMITSFADRRWTVDENDNLYTHIGFHLSKILKPDYKYYNSHIHGNKRIHKMILSKNNMIKKYGLDKKLTEWEMAKQLGYDRIWDCGLLKYVWIRNER